jgi:hypothetical protein
LAREVSQIRIVALQKVQSNLLQITSTIHRFKGCPEHRVVLGRDILRAVECTINIEEMKEFQGAKEEWD